MPALLVANFKIMVRDRQTLFWTLVFPLIFVLAFGLFDVGEPGSVDLAIIDRANNPVSLSIQEELAQIDFLDINTEYSSQDEAEEAVRDGDLEYLLVIPDSLAAEGGGAPVPLALYYDKANIVENQIVEGVIRQLLDEVNLQVAQVDRAVHLVPQAVQAQEVDYFDVLLVGLAGMGVMFNSVMVIAVAITSYRSQGILKRILVTPLPVRYYFAAEILSRTLLALVQTAIILGVGVLIFGGRIHGNLGWLFLIVALSTPIFLNIGFAIAGLARSAAAASGIGNVVVVPMMFFSGTFFPTSSLPSFLPELVQVLPLTPMLEAMRGVALDGKGIWEVWRELAMLGGWLVFSSLAAVRMFRFS